MSFPPGADPNPESDPTPDVDPPAGDPPAPGTGAAGLSPDAIRNSPEFKELAKQNRTLARQAGQNARAAEAARTAAEQARQAAEAQQQADLEAELSGILGEEGVTLYNEIAELSASDPKAAARKMAEAIAAARAQSSGQPPAPDAPPAPPAPGGDGTVPNTPPAPPRGVAADAPLGQPPAAPEDHLQIAADLEKGYQAIVDRVQDPQTRRRVTMKDRAAGFIGYVGAAVLKAGARPSNPR